MQGLHRAETWGGFLFNSTLWMSVEDQMGGEKEKEKAAVTSLKNYEVPGNDERKPGDDRHSTGNVFSGTIMVSRGGRR